MEALIANDAAKLRYLSLAGDVARLYRAILPDPAANQYNAQRALFAVLADKIRALAPVPDISGVLGEVNDLLDESIKPDGYVIRAAATPVREAGAGQPDHVLDLSKLDLDALQRRFAQGRKHIEAEKLRGALNVKLARMVRLNRSRMDYLRQFQAMIDDYNSGAGSVETFFANLIAFAQGLDAEEQRGIAENLSEEELALFDLLTKPAHDDTEQIGGARSQAGGAGAAAERSRPNGWCWIGASSSRPAPRSSWPLRMRWIAACRPPIRLKCSSRSARRCICTCMIRTTARGGAYTRQR